MPQFIKLTRVLRGSEISFPQLFNIDTISAILPEDMGMDQCNIVTIGYSDGYLVKESFKTVCDLITTTASSVPQQKSLVKG